MANLLVYALLLLASVYVLVGMAHDAYGLGNLGLTKPISMMFAVGAVGVAFVLLARDARRAAPESATVLVEVATDMPGPAALADASAMLGAASASARGFEAEGDGFRVLLDWRGPGAAEAAGGTEREGVRLTGAEEPLVLPRASRAAKRAVYGSFRRVERVERGSDGQPVDGGWTPFSAWGACVPHSGVCGDGAQTRRRGCTAPRPQNRGRPCEGEGQQTRACVVEC